MALVFLFDRRAWTEGFSLLLGPERPCKAIKSRNRSPPHPPLPWSVSRRVKALWTRATSHLGGFRRRPMGLKTGCKIGGLVPARMAQDPVSCSWFQWRHMDLLIRILNKGGKVETGLSEICPGSMCYDSEWMASQFDCKLLPYTPYLNEIDSL